MIKNFKSLNIWRRSRGLVKDLYAVTQHFPSDEKFGLTSQIRRAAISIPSNISEGCGRKSKKDFSRFLDMAIGSTCEVETQLYISFDLKFIDQTRMEKYTDEVCQIRKMIIGFQQTL